MIKYFFKLFSDGKEINYFHERRRREGHAENFFFFEIIFRSVKDARGVLKNLKKINSDIKEMN